MPLDRLLALRVASVLGMTSPDAISVRLHYCILPFSYLFLRFATKQCSLVLCVHNVEHAVTAAAGLPQDVSTRYGHPVVVLNLVKSAEKRPRETILRKEFAISIAYINQQV